MIRNFTLLLGLLAALSPIAGATQTIPAHINLHNGYIQINNHIKVFTKNGSQTEEQMWVVLNGFVSQFESAHIATGTSGSINKCCILAGTYYKAYVRGGGIHKEFGVRPRLCNVRGIPFGFAVIDIYGKIQEVDHNGRIPNDWVPSGIHVTVNDTTCPHD